MDFGVVVEEFWTSGFGMRRAEVVGKILDVVALLRGGLSIFRVSRFICVRYWLQELSGPWV